MNKEKLAKLRQLIDISRNISYATVNEDGTPHNTPMFFIPSSDLRTIFWGSHPKAKHTENMLRTGQAFAVVYDMIDEKAHGLYFKIENCREASGKELEIALIALNTRRTKLSKPPLEISYYISDSPQCMYLGDITEISTNQSERDVHGNLIQDHRVKVNRSDLVK